MQLYLKDNIQFAPYIWDWYAWSYLIPPHTAAANITNRHIKIMESFIDAPELHLQAINTHGLLGGPFIHLEEHYLHDIKNLLQKTKQECRHLLQLHNDIQTVSSLLSNEASGDSVESLYHVIPDSLKGMIELQYDINNHPQIRFLEPLLYRQYYSTQSQTICFSEAKQDNRPFSLGTPYIDRPDTVQIDLSFSSSLIDQLAMMKSIPSSIDDMMETLSISRDKKVLFRSFFTEKPRLSTPAPYQGAGIKVTYMGHACVLIQSKKLSILIDPMLGYQTDILTNNRKTAADLPEVIDYVFITHNHQDHLLLETLLQIRHKIKNIVVPRANSGVLTDPSMKLILTQLGFKQVISIEEFDQLALNSIDQAIALPFLGEHGDLNILSKCSYYFCIEQQKLLFLADSNNMTNDLYLHLYDIIKDVDVIFIGMECVGAPLSWLYGPLFHKPLSRQQDQSRRLSGSNAKKALDIIKIFKSKEVYIYAMGMEPWLSYIMAIQYDDHSPAIVESNLLIDHCKMLGIKAERLYGQKELIYY